MQNFVFLCYENIGQADIRNGRGDLLDSVKFSEGIKKPSGQDHTAAEGNYVIKASCRKKEARKTGIFLTLKKEWHQETALVLEKPGSCTSTIAANIRIQPESSRPESA